MKLLVWFKELEPLTSAFISFLTVLTFYYVLKIVAETVFIFRTIYSYFAAREEMKRLTTLLTDEFNKTQFKD